MKGWVSESALVPAAGTVGSGVRRPAGPQAPAQVRLLGPAARLRAGGECGSDRRKQRNISPGLVSGLSACCFANRSLSAGESDRMSSEREGEAVRTDGTFRGDRGAAALSRESRRRAWLAAALGPVRLKGAHGLSRPAEGRLGEPGGPERKLPSTEERQAVFALNGRDWAGTSWNTWTQPTMPSAHASSGSAPRLLWTACPHYPSAHSHQV